MREKYNIYPINRVQLITSELEQEEFAGYLTKFWVRVPKLGKSLVKLEEDTAPGWSEKVSYELAKELGIPAARYELGTYETRPVMVSPNFKQKGLTYIDGDTLIRNTLEDSSYRVENAIASLELNNVGLPLGWNIPEGIEDGADLFVGYLMLDCLIANNDRHGGNWEIGIANNGEKTLAPLFDNGASFGVDFGSLVYNNKTPQEYNESIISMWGVSTKNAFYIASTKRPVAANAWLNKLKSLKITKIQDLFDRVPSDRLNEQAKNYGLELVKLNKSELLTDKQLFANASQAILQTKTWQERTTTIADTIFACLKLEGNKELVSKDYQAVWDSDNFKIVLNKNNETIFTAKRVNDRWQIQTEHISSSDLSYWRKLSQSMRLKQQQQQRSSSNKEELEP